MRTRGSLPATIGAVLAVGLLVVRPSWGLDTQRRLTQFSRDLWSTNDGLPDGEIGAITQTADGYLWLATQRGLARFDGVQFRLVTRETTPGLPVNYVLSLARARDGALWLGTRGLGRYAQGQWQFFPDTAQPQHPYVFAIVEDETGRLWVGTGGSGIWSLAAGRLVQLPAYRKKSLPADILGLALGAQGRLWAATDGGVLLVQGDDVRLFTRKDGLADDRVNVVYVDRAGVVWAGTPRGLSRLEGQRFRPLAAPDGSWLQDVRALLMDRDGGLWIGTAKGLVRFAHGRFERLDRARGLADDTVTALTEDREGTVWVGTGAGLNRLREGTFTPFRGDEGLDDENVQGVHVARDGRVFFATFSGAVAYLADDGVHAVLPRGTLQSNVVSFAETRDGSIWVSGKALRRIQGGHVTSYGGDGHAVTVMREDGDGLLVARAERDSSCSLQRFQDGRFTPLFAETRLPGVYDLLRDRHGSLWVATDGGGLHRFSSSGQHEVLREVGGLASDTVRHLFEDATGTLWLAAQGGLARLRNGRWFAFAAASGVPTEQPDRFLEDRTGGVWCAWEGGVFRARLADLAAFADGQRGPVEVQRYAAIDGLPSIRVSWRQSAFSRAPDGRIWVATSRGLAVADPRILERAEAPPPLYIDSFLVDGLPLPATAEPELAPGSDRLELRFTAPTFAAPHRVRFEHQLLGHDPDWIDDGTRRSAHYTNLPPGSYLFRVRARSADGAWGATTATSLGFVLRPRWHQTGLARGAALVALLGLSIAVYRLRVAMVERRAREEGMRRLNAELEQRVLERTVEVAAEKERLAVTLRSIGDGVIATDVDGRITLLNRQAELLCGWAAQEGRGRPLPEVLRLVDRDTREPIADPGRMVLERGSVCSLPESSLLLTRDGREVLVADSAAPMRDSESRVVGVVIVFRDVSERQRLDEELRKRDKLDALGILAGGIAHDFNNLLTGILGYLDLALLTGGDGDKLARHIDAARAVSQRARGLTRQLLTFARGERPSSGAFFLRELVEGCARMALSGSGTSCELALAPDLWPCAGDEAQIGQVVDNLLINARQAMPDGGRVLVTARNLELQRNAALPLEPGRYVELEVRDEGQGIPRELRDKVFDPFFTTKQAGSGLGLATAWSIVKKHRGHIDFESTPGQGTTFRIVLPAGEPAPHVATTRRAELRGSGRILLMDDEDYVRDLTREALARRGFEVELARDGKEALALFTAALAAQRPFDLVILDQTVPGGMGGRATLARLLALAPEIRAVAASGYTSDPVMSDPAAHGFCAALVKPYTLADLDAAVATALGKGSLPANRS